MFLLGFSQACWFLVWGMAVSTSIAFSTTHIQLASFSNRISRNRLRASSSATSSSETSQKQAPPDVTDEHASSSCLQEALQASHERALDQFISSEAPSWMQDTDAFPFSCTECGKCCKTQGEVFLAPEDITLAAKIRAQTPVDFVQQYAASYLLSPSALREGKDIPSSSSSPSSTKVVLASLESLVEDQQVWIRLREGEEGACVFLEKETNHCQIYEARPTQCRTYPFWPSIMKAPDAWNDECRRADDDVSSNLPTWSAERGGCEGMRLLMTSSTSTNDDDDDAVSLAAADDSDDGVPLRDACQQLMEYSLTDRRFPYQAEERPVPTMTTTVTQNMQPSATK